MKETSMSGNENITFVQFQEPGLKAGDYLVSAELSIQPLPAAAFAAAPGAPSAPAYQVDKYLRVAGDRYALAVESVDSVYPPHATTGDYSRALPHIVLRRPTLPWERTIADDAATPWMTVLLLSDEELQAEGLDPTHPLTPATRLDEGESIACSLLSISGQLWSCLAPSADDLIALAHVRKSAPSRRIDTEDAELRFSIVLGHRLPPQGKACSAFLVSLENMADKLYPARLDGKLDLVVLHAWRFFAQKELDHSFGQVIQSLDRATGLALPHPKDGQAGAPLAMGFVPASHDLRVGGSTWSWYRGPFTPYGTQRVIRQPSGKPAAWADGLLFYDPDLGMFDTSCAAAWTLGRLMGLNDTAFATAVSKARAEKVQHTLERVRFQLTFGKLAGPRALGEAMRTEANETLAHGLLTALTTLGGAAPGMAATFTAQLPSDLQPTLLSSPDRTRLLEQALTQPERIAELHGISAHTALLHATPPDPAELSPTETWLAQAALLHGVPLHYLIPHPAMLPQESIRFFQVDLSWLEAFRDGALSPGRNSGTDASHDAAFVPLLHLGSGYATSLVRPQNRRLRAQAASPTRPLSGFLLRSDALLEWPDMEVEGRIGDTVVTTLRQQTIGPILLCLFDQVVDRVDIHQPAQAVHFGFLPKGDPSHVAKFWRKPTGERDPARPLKEIPFRDAAAGVLDLAELRKASGSTRSDQFALQMVSGVDRVVFRIAPPPA